MRGDELPVTLDSLAAARSFFEGFFARSDPSQENLWVAHLDEEARCLHVSHHMGDEAGAAFPIREIIVDAAAHCSAGLVLAHNHPSGDARPSESDCRATRRLATAAQALGCRVLDHLIFAGKECSSLRQLGYL